MIIASVFEMFSDNEFIKNYEIISPMSLFRASSEIRDKCIHIYTNYWII